MGVLENFFYGGHSARTPGFARCCVPMPWRAPAHIVGMAEGLVTLSEVARLAGVDRQLVRHWAMRAEINVTKVRAAWGWVRLDENHRESFVDSFADTAGAIFLMHCRAFRGYFGGVPPEALFAPLRCNSPVTRIVVASFWRAHQHVLCGVIRGYDAARIAKGLK